MTPSPDLSDLLRRVREATGPITLQFTSDGDELLIFGRALGLEDGAGFALLYAALGGSVDAALGLVERQKMDVRTVLYDALQTQGMDGYRPDEPMGPQIARAVIAEVLAALLTSLEHGK